MSHRGHDGRGVGVALTYLLLEGEGVADLDDPLPVDTRDAGILVEPHGQDPDGGRDRCQPGLGGWMNSIRTMSSRATRSGRSRSGT